MRSEMKQGVQQGELAANGVCRTDIRRANAKKKKKKMEEETVRYKEIVMCQSGQRFLLFVQIRRNAGEIHVVMTASHLKRKMNRRNLVSATIIDVVEDKVILRHYCVR